MNLEELATLASYIVTTMSIITATTNTPPNNSVLGKVYKVIEFFALVNDKVKQK